MPITTVHLNSVVIPFDWEGASLTWSHLAQHLPHLIITFLCSNFPIVILMSVDLNEADLTRTLISNGFVAAILAFGTPSTAVKIILATSCFLTALLANTIGGKCLMDVGFRLRSCRLSLPVWQTLIKWMQCIKVLRERHSFLPKNVHRLKHKFNATNTSVSVRIAMDSRRSSATFLRQC